MTNWTRVCCRCNSEIGFNPEQPEFCSVCWKRRIPVPKKLLEEIERLRGTRRAK